MRRSSVTAWFVLFFLLSGFCSLVDEVVWLRLAMAGFGVTTPFVSIVLSVFMGGLALGSWGAGKLSARLESARAATPLRTYAVAELIIGLSALAVPAELRWGQSFMERGGGEVAWASASYYAVSGAWILLSLLPFTTAMGATFPLAMSALRRREPANAARSFSILYLANVLGAASGTLVSALFLIELLGFRRTLLVAGALNLALAVAAYVLSLGAPDESEARASSGAAGKPAGAAAPRRSGWEEEGAGPGARASVGAGAHASASANAGASAGAAGPSAPSPVIPWLLFTTGLVSMAMEVIWVRQYTPFIGNEVYSFATILVVYLLATFAGSAAYRRWARPRPLDHSDRAWMHAWAVTGLFAVLPLMLVDPSLLSSRGFSQGALRVVLGIAPFCAAAGFLTPLLIDRWSGGDPAKAGRVYAVNILGCIIGPLAAGFVLLPRIGERWSVIVLALPLFCVGLIAVVRPDVLMSRAAPPSSAGRGLSPARWLGIAASALAVVIALVTHDYEVRFRDRVTRRDYAATVIATGQGMQRMLLVNGVSMTSLSTLTKMMIHLPMTMLDRPPENSLVICFGMGTSFRSALTWAAPCTAVDLIPSVPELFGYYHADASAVSLAPGARIVVDDGRRYLARTPTRYSVIAVDPPPPLEAAGSSLLYSREFHALVRSRLRPGGIVSFWLPEGEPAIMVAIVKTAAGIYPHLRVYRSIAGWGFHLIASNEPIRVLPPEALAARLPAPAAADLVEWDRSQSPEDLLRKVIGAEFPVQRILVRDPSMPAIEDDRPVNEYFFTRRLLAGTLDLGSLNAGTY